MGVTKRLLDEAMERGYSPPESDYVCVDCVTNPYLKEALDGAAIADVACDYCQSNCAAPIEVLLNEVSDAAFAGYTDPANELPFESREGGYHGETLESWEIIDMIGSWTDNEALQRDVELAFADRVWCKVNYYSLTEAQSLRFGWQQFTSQIKHRTRYLFLQEQGDDQHDEIPPARMLAEVEKRLHTLLVPLEAGTLLYRVRVIPDGVKLTDPGELGAPPLEFVTVDNRMSPAGIPMFYAAEDIDTAVAETLDPSRATGRTLAIGKWRTVRDLTLLDLTDLPDVPDPFDHENAWQADRVRFIHAFAQELTKPVDREKGSVDYVPTQAVAEHVRWRMRTEDGDRVDGIRYASSQRQGGVAVVLFAQQENCVGPQPNAPSWERREQLIELAGVDHVRASEFVVRGVEPPPGQSALLNDDV